MKLLITQKMYFIWRAFKKCCIFIEIICAFGHVWSSMFIWHLYWSFIRWELQNSHGSCPQSCRHKLRWNPQHSAVSFLSWRKIVIVWITLKIICFIMFFFLAMLTAPRTSNAMLSSMRIPTISWCANWRMKWPGWRNCSVPRAWETFWTVSFMLSQLVVSAASDLLCQGPPQTGNVFYLHYCLVTLSHLTFSSQCLYLWLVHH